MITKERLDISLNICWRLAFNPRLGKEGVGRDGRLCPRRRRIWDLRLWLGGLRFSLAVERIETYAGTHSDTNVDMYRNANTDVDK